MGGSRGSADRAGQLNWAGHWRRRRRACVSASELAYALGESRSHAEGLLAFAHALETRLPGTKAALRDGTITRAKAEIIWYATQLLDEAEARAAEGKVLGRAGRLTPGSLRAAIARAVMETAPEKARRRREAAAKDARVQRWAEDSGNAALMGRELPPAEVLAADQLAGRAAAHGGAGRLDGRAARPAYLDLLLGKDSRPRQDSPDGGDGAGPGRDDSGQPGQAPAGRPAPGGFAGKVTLTVPLATLTGLDERPGEIAGIGPADPDPGANT